MRCQIPLPFLKLIQKAGVRAVCLHACATWRNACQAPQLVCLCTLSLMKMKSVNPNVSDGDKIPDSTHHHAIDFPRSSLWFWLTGHIADSSVVKRVNERPENREKEKREVVVL